MLFEPNIYLIVYHQWFILTMLLLMSGFNINIEEFKAFK